MEGATQTRLDYLPEHATDFVFASFAEQRGFVGAAILLLLYLLVVWRGLRVITVAGDYFTAIVAGGIVVAFLFQVFVNVGMTMGIAPVTGIPLPFVTVGGSSMVANLLAIGVLQAIHARGAIRAETPLMAALRAGRRVRRSSASCARPRRQTGPLQVSGMLAEQLARELRAGGDASFVRVGGDPAGARRARDRARRAPRPEEEAPAASRRPRAHADHRRPDREGAATSTSRTSSRRTSCHCPPGAGFPVDEIAAAVAARLGEAGTGLAAKLPVLREAVCRELIVVVLAQERRPRGRGLRPRRRLPGADD